MKRSKCKCTCDECGDECNPYYKQNCNTPDSHKYKQALEEIREMLPESKCKYKYVCFSCPESGQCKEEWAEQLDQLKSLIEKYGECNKYIVEENGRIYTRLEYKLLRTINEIKPILEIYANSSMGEKQPDKTYHIRLNNGYIMVYDPKPARQALQKISEVEYDNK